MSNFPSQSSAEVPIPTENKGPLSEKPKNPLMKVEDSLKSGIEKVKNNIEIKLNKIMGMFNKQSIEGHSFLSQADALEIANLQHKLNEATTKVETVISPLTNHPALITEQATNANNSNQNKTQSELISPTNILDNLRQISESPIFAAGSEKNYRLMISASGEKVVIAEYRDKLSKEHLRAIVAQQRILNTIYPDKFVVQIHEYGIGLDGIARFTTDFVEIDKEKSINATGPGWDGLRTIKYTKQVRESDEFKTSIPELKIIGLIPQDENEQGAPHINELAANTVYDKNGNQIIVDVQSPIQGYNDKNIDKYSFKPALNIDGVLQIADKKGVREAIQPLVSDYKAATTAVIAEKSKS